MKTKHPRTRKLLKKKSHPIIELYFEIAQLKNLYRQGWLERGISEKECETVADHTFSMALLAYCTAEEYRKDLDALHVMRLVMFHELGEIYAGDITPGDNISSEEKHQRELAGIQQVLSNFPNAQKYIEYWEEYENRETPEAQFVYQIDKLEMVLQAFVYEKSGQEDLDEFFVSVKKHMHDPEIKKIYNDLIRLRKE